MDEAELSDELRAELNRRIDALEKDPMAVTPWEVVEARALERLRGIFDDAHRQIAEGQDIPHDEFWREFETENP